MRKLLICLLLTLPIPLNTAGAADCVDTACIDVYTQDGQIIIEGKKGSGPKAKVKPRTVKPSPKPTVVKPIFPELIPRPTATPTPSPKPTPKRTYKPRAKPTGCEDRQAGFSYSKNGGLGQPLAHDVCRLPLRHH
jgi:hypothetical protein